MNLRVRLIMMLVAASVGVTGCATVLVVTQTRRADAQRRVAQAIDVIYQMQSKPGAGSLLSDAMGVLIVPDYTNVAFVVGSHSGVGVLLARHNGHWSDPAFFTIGGVSFGLQAGTEVGPVAYVLMTSRAVQEFEDQSVKARLEGDVALTVAKLSVDARIASTVPTADVIVWTGTAGVFGGLAFNATDVVTNTSLDEAYYGSASISRILDGTVHNRLADGLRLALSTQLARQ